MARFARCESFVCVAHSVTHSSLGLHVFKRYCMFVSALYTLHSQQRRESPLSTVMNDKVCMAACLSRAYLSNFFILYPPTVTFFPGSCIVSHLRVL